MISSSSVMMRGHFLILDLGHTSMATDGLSMLQYLMLLDLRLVFNKEDVLQE